MNIKIKPEDMAEFIGQIIDVFEDFLEDRGVELNNSDKQQAIADGEDEDSIAILYGEDYGELQYSISNILSAWEN